MSKRGMGMLDKVLTGVVAWKQKRLGREVCSEPSAEIKILWQHNREMGTVDNENQQHRQLG